MTEEKNSTDRIMVVDDVPENLKLLEGMLRDCGYRVVAFPRGNLAIKAAQKDPPDLILLDIMMPGLDGYAVCERLKADPNLRDIPVIFISALDEISDKVEAFRRGGVDYVTKPFQFEEVEARVKAHLQLRRQQLRIEEQLRKLRDLEELRDSLLHMIIHDMRSPLGVFTNAARFLEGVLDLEPGNQQMLTVATQAARELDEMINSLLDVNRMESGEMPLNPTNHDLLEIGRAVVDSIRGSAEFAGVQLDISGTNTSACFDKDLFRRVLSNLVGNAIKYCGAGSSIKIRILSSDTVARVEVADDGPGIPAESRERIFEKFGLVEDRRTTGKHSTGLGLAFCKLAVEAHHGRIGVESEVNVGSTFWFELPRT